MPAVSTNDRDLALDAFRGLAVLGMVLVNLQGSGPVAFGAFEHAEWNGVTLADLVFPFFLLAAGLAVPLALDRRAREGVFAAVLRRAVLLFLIGVAINWLYRPSADPHALRVAGVLQRIAIVYLACAWLCLVIRGWRVPLIVAGLLLTVHGALLFVPAPGEAAASFGQGQGMSAWLDRLALPGRPFRPDYDPEGLLSTLSAIASGMIGVTVQRMVQHRGQHRGRTGGSSLRLIGAAAVLCLILAGVAALWWPFNKALWTPSFALLTTGLGLALWGLLRAVWSRLEASAWARRGALFVALLGQTALTLYVVQALLAGLLIQNVGEDSLWGLSFGTLSRIGLSPAWTSLLFAVIAGAVSIAITLWLRRRGWLLRL
ncbi:acyltransferase family protein [Sphingomonas sp.]|uniref:acyltransferase family protein n=1 Tax=Sphingomonas sp. TaxID=28214 RepID=UPI003D6CE296